jgi:hypothetical protein
MKKAALEAAFFYTPDLVKPIGFIDELIACCELIISACLEQTHRPVLMNQ